jgi:diacylglycerol kinase (ATP)
LLRLWRATINTRNGLAFAIRSEQAVREEIFALALSLPAAWLVGETMMRRFELVAAVAFVLVVELLNTAVGVALVMAGLFWLFALAERMGAI